MANHLRISHEKISDDDPVSGSAFRHRAACGMVNLASQRQSLSGSLLTFSCRSQSFDGIFDPFWQADANQPS